MHYFGETGQAAEQSANVIKNVYSAGVGESMDAVANAVLMVKKNLGDLSETDLTNLTQQAITLEELYGIDMNETLRGVNSLMQQYGLTAQQAMDYIVVGTQNGLDKTNELGITFPSMQVNSHRPVFCLGVFPAAGQWSEERRLQP